MKTRTLALVAGIVLVAASAVGLQAAELKRTSMPDTFSTDTVNSVPSILGSIDKSSAYQEMSGKEMKEIQGEATYIRYISVLTGRVIGYTRISRWPRRWNVYINVYVP